jgi:sugar lactone lactonase YvrE
MNGGLFCIERDGTIEQLWDGTDCANGMAFTGDLRGFYWTDTSARIIWALDYDRDTGELSNKRPFWVSDGRGVPDGLTIDCDGDLWVAFYDAGCVRVIGSDAEIKQEIKLPAPNITSCVFGGPDMSTLFVTSAQGNDDDSADNLRGALFALQTATSGRAEFISRILID